MKKELKKLNTEYETICNKYVKLFCNKQGIEDYFWLGDKVGEIACFNEQYYFNLSDIILDLNSKAKKGLIIQWQEDSIENEMLLSTPFEELQDINYNSYIKGVRYKNLKTNKKVKL